MGADCKYVPYLMTQLYMCQSDTDICKTVVLGAFRVTVRQQFEIDDPPFMEH